MLTPRRRPETLARQHSGLKATASPSRNGSLGVAPLVGNRQPQPKRKARRILWPCLDTFEAILQYEGIAQPNHVSRVSRRRPRVDVGIENLKRILFAHFAEVPARRKPWSSVPMWTSELPGVLNCALTPQGHEKGSHSKVRDPRQEGSASALSRDDVDEPRAHNCRVILGHVPIKLAHQRVAPPKKGCQVRSICHEVTLSG